MLAKYAHKLSANFNVSVLTLLSSILIAEGNIVFLAEFLLPIIPSIMDQI